MSRIGIIGAGAWGTALAAALAPNLTLWARETEVPPAINHSRENPQFLPGITLPAATTATTTMADLATSSPGL